MAIQDLSRPSRLCGNPAGGIQRQYKWSASMEMAINDQAHFLPNIAYMCLVEKKQGTCQFSKHELLVPPENKAFHSVLAHTPMAMKQNIVHE